MSNFTKGTQNARLLLRNNSYRFQLAVQLCLLFLIRESWSFIARGISQEGVELYFFTSIMDCYQKDMWRPASQIISCELVITIDHGLFSKEVWCRCQCLRTLTLSMWRLRRSLVDVTAEWMGRAVESLMDKAAAYLLDVAAAIAGVAATTSLVVWRRQRRSLVWQQRRGWGDYVPDRWFGGGSFDAGVATAEWMRRRRSCRWCGGGGARSSAKLPWSTLLLANWWTGPNSTKLFSSFFVFDILLGCRAESVTLNPNR
jgi:hypothetical protein